MISEKKPNETLFVERYVDDDKWKPCDKWKTSVVIPCVTCLEELEIMLDLENEQL